MKTAKTLRRSAFTALLVLYVTQPPAPAAELGALARVFSWSNTPNNFSTYEKGGTGIVQNTAK